MNHAARILAAMAAVMAMAILDGSPSARAAAAKTSDAKPAAPATAKPAPATAKPAPALPASPYRRLASGVMEPTNVLAPGKQMDETVQRGPLTELLAVDNNFDWAKDVPFRRDVWMLDFQFKPVRMIWVDVPGDGGQMQRKLIWYMLYSVTNTGKEMHPVEQGDKTYKVVYVDKPVRFIPSFTLEAHNRLQDEAAGFTKAYTDKLIPVAMAPIQMREDRNRKFLSTVDMAAQEISVGQTVWGIATWEDIDPRTVWFSVYIEGLTNAYRWTDDAAKYASKQPYRTIYRKALKLNFWRPGDEFTLKETQIRLGVPVMDSSPKIPDYEWVWRRAF